MKPGGWLAIVTVGLASSAAVKTATPVPYAACQAFDSIDLTATAADWPEFYDVNPDEIIDEWVTQSGSMEAVPTGFRIRFSASGLTGPRFREIEASKLGRRWTMRWRNAGFDEPADYRQPQFSLGAWQQVRVSIRDGRALDQLVASPCLWREPRSLPSVLVMKDGRRSSAFHQPLALLRVWSPGHQWTGLHAWRLGVSGAIQTRAADIAFPDDWLGYSASLEEGLGS